MNLKSTILLIIGVVMMIWGTLATMQNITDALSTRTTIGTYNNGTITTKDGKCLITTESAQTNLSKYLSSLIQKELTAYLMTKL